ncbi:MAG TPA: methyltransferase domain-containing protein [Ktedonobacterales bacterium]
MLSHLHGHSHEPEAAKTEGLLINWAARYDLLVALVTLGHERRFRGMAADLAQLRHGEVALEVGCGTGGLAMEARRRVGTAGRVNGIDPSAQMIARAQRKAAQGGLAIEYQVGVIERLPFPDHSFDVVLSSLMMHHLPDDVKRQGLAEIARTLKPGGRLFVIDASRPAGPWQSDLHDLPALMRAAGFTQITLGKTRIPGLGFALGRTSEHDV